MKRWQALVGVGLLIVMVPLALGGGGKNNVLPAQASVAPKHFLEVGKSYAVTFPNGSELVPCKVVEQPHDNWVKVKARGGDAITWINLNQVASIMLLREGD